ncbi:MAG: DUF1214 domain-containing protein [Alphaproteobacteria bacterium]|nr:DUF1214 domain-containing protein [Alphaproteobacteria bacterium]
MTPFIRITIFVLVGCAIGYFSAHYVISGQIGDLTMESGSWKLWKKAGHPDADPYTKAHFSLLRELPLSSFEQMTFSADTDFNGGSLSSVCTYTLDSAPLPARAWELSVQPRSNPALATFTSQRTTFNASNVVRNSQGNFRLVLSDSARPGNWLPLPINGAEFKLVLTLINAGRKIIEDPATLKLPEIRVGSCR